MTASNVHVVSNIYPVKTSIQELNDGEQSEVILQENNGPYFQQIADLKALRTACDSCCYMSDPAEKPYGRVRVAGKLVDICKCQNTTCHLFHSECRPDYKRSQA